MPDSYIDGLAKENLERFQPEFDPEDWKAMDAMLDSKKTAGVWSNARRLMIAAAAILLFITGGLLGYFIDKSSTPDAILDHSQPAYTLDNKENTGTVNDKENNELILEQENTSSSEGNKGIKNESNGNNIVPPVKTNTNAIAGTGSGKKKNNVAVPIVEEKHENQTSFNDQKIKGTLTFFDMAREDMLNFMPYKELSKDLALLPETDFDQQLKDLKGKKRIQTSIGYTMSPDLNIPNNSSGGFTTGVTGEVVLSNKVSLSSGILFSNKRYKDESTLKATADYIPEATTATFHLLEIPLMVKYNIISDKRTKPFIAAGVSGYFPLKEEYDIECLVSTGYGGYPSYVSQETTNSNIVVNSYSSSEIARTLSSDVNMQEDKTINNYHLKPYLGFLNLSAGVEYRMSPAISFQLAPQVKLPMTGMGLEEKMVTTISLNSSIRYHFGN